LETTPGDWSDFLRGFPPSFQTTLAVTSLAVKSALCNACEYAYWNTFSLALMYLANTNKKATIGHQRPKTLFTNIDLEMW